MSYLVLARKWRPQAFADMTGQEHVVRTLANAIAQDRVAHAFLFCGPRGVGKTTAARILARALNCVNGPTAEPCGACAPCTEVMAGNSIDVAEIDGASNNSVDDVRQIRERVTYLTQRDRYKIYIIDEVHMLTTSAFNALLKTLEEPPPHVKFIFATTEPHKLPDTILSRCQRHNFRRIPTVRMVERLKQIGEAEGAKLSDRALAQVARQSEGGMRDALSLMDMIFSAVGREATDEQVAEALGAVDRTAVHDICEAMIRRDAKTVLRRVDDQYVRGIDFKRLAEEIALYLRHLIVARATSEAPDELADSEKKAVLALAGETDPAQLTRLFDLVHGAIWEISRAAQPRLATEVTLLKGIHLAPSAPVSELLARAEALASRLGDASTPASTRSSGSAPAAEGGRPEPRPFREPIAPPPEPPAPSSPPPATPPVSESGARAPLVSARYAAAEPERVFENDASVGGCATGECFEEPAAPPGPAAVVPPSPIAEPTVPAPAPATVAPAPEPEPVSSPSAPAAALTPASFENPRVMWQAVVNELRSQKKDLLANALANGRLLQFEPTRVRLGFEPLHTMFRRQLEQRVRDAEAAITKVAGRPVSLVIEAVSAAEAEEAPQSLAGERVSKVKARDERIRRASRENPMVLAALRIFDGTVEDIKVVDAPEEDFTPAVEDELE